MTSQAVEEAGIRPSGNGRFRGEWVKYNRINKKIKVDNTKKT